MYLLRFLPLYCVFYQCYHTMSTFIHCSVVGVVSVYPQIWKIIPSAFVSCVLNHYDVNDILYDGRLDGRCLCNCSLSVPIYQLDVVCRAICRRCGRSCINMVPEKGRFRTYRIWTTMSLIRSFWRNYGSSCLYMVALRRADFRTYRMWTNNFLR